MTIIRDVGQVQSQAPSSVRPEPGAPIRSLWPVYAPDEIEAVNEVLRSGKVNSLVHGERCRAFEAGVAKLCDTPFAICVANGTLALELALRALGIGTGDEVIVTPRSFVASASCVVTCGAKPVFADVDSESQNISADTVEPLITPRTRAIIAVHLAGYPCDMDGLCALARRHGLKIIEDCAQAIGATYRGRPVGSFGNAAAFSFCTDKIISTGGEGGMLLLKDESTWTRAWSYKDHGKDPARVGPKHSGSQFRWLHHWFGSNYRMTEMQGAIGLRQLAKLPGWIEERRARAGLLNEILRGQPALRLTEPPPEIGHVFYKYYAFVRPERLTQGWTRDRVLDEAARAGVPCGSGVCAAIYLEDAYIDAGLGPDEPLPVATELGETSLMLPVDPTIELGAIQAMGERLSDIIERATN